MKLVFLLLSFSLQVFGDCECGVRQGGRNACGRRARVAGGTRAEKGEFPWAALLVFRKPGGTHRCGATLINDRFVLTTAHCTTYSDNIDVILGKTLNLWQQQ